MFQSPIVPKRPQELSWSALLTNLTELRDISLIFRSHFVYSSMKSDCNIYFLYGLNFFLVIGLWLIYFVPYCHLSSWDNQKLKSVWWFFFFGVCFYSKMPSLGVTLVFPLVSGMGQLECGWSVVRVSVEAEVHQYQVTSSWILLSPYIFSHYKSNSCDLRD